METVIAATENTKLFFIGSCSQSISAFFGPRVPPLHRQQNASMPRLDIAVVRVN